MRSTCLPKGAYFSPPADMNLCAVSVMFFQLLAQRKITFLTIIRSWHIFLLIRLVSSFGPTFLTMSHLGLLFSNYLFMSVDLSYVRPWKFNFTMCSDLWRRLVSDILNPNSPTCCSRPYLMTSSGLSNSTVLHHRSSLIPLFFLQEGILRQFLLWMLVPAMGIYKKL